jgi:hypothetical protein
MMASAMVLSNFNFIIVAKCSTTAASGSGAERAERERETG